MQTFADDVLAYIHQNPESASWIVLAVAFLESLAIVGVFVPGWLFLLGIGALIGSQVLPFYSLCVAMFLGAVIGEGVSFWLGYYSKDRLRHWRWFEQHQKVLLKADRFMAEYGVISLVIGRFIGPVRAVLPFVAGVSGMSHKVFWSVNISSALLWAPLYLFPGMLLGMALALPEGSREVMAVFLFALILFLWLARHWWWQSKKIPVQFKKLRWQSILAMSCAFVLTLVFIISPVGQQVLQVLGHLLARVA